MSVTVLATTTEKVKIKPSTRRQLVTELKAYAKLDAQLKALEAEKEEHKAVIAALREETGATSLEVDGFTVTYVVTKGRESLDKKLLLANGVSMGQIENSTVRTPTAPYVKVTAPRL